MDNNTLITSWNSWANSAPSDEWVARVEAVDILKAYLNHPDDMLNLDGLGLTSLPDLLPDSINFLSANDNKLTALPETLPDSITEIEVNNNLLIAFPKNLPQNLISLDCNNNQLKMLPGNLPNNLLRLSVSNNKLETLPNILPAHLKQLFVDKNKLTALPVFSDTLMSSLESLDLSYNQLTTVPDSLIKMTANDALVWLTGNPLTPQSVSDLQSITLAPNYKGPNFDLKGFWYTDKYKVAWGNWVDDAPNELERMARLKAVEALHAVAINESKVLDLSHLGLTSLPELLPPYLETLNVSDNQLTQLPQDLPKNLIVLEAGGNLLDKLPTKLPQELQDLNVGNNKFLTIPNGSLPDSITDLNLSGNLLTMIPDRLPRDLNKLIIGYNQIDSLPENLLLHAYQYSFLDLRGNKLTDFPAEYLNSNIRNLTLELDDNPMSDDKINYLRSLITESYFKLDVTLPLTTADKKILAVWQEWALEVHDDPEAVGRNNAVDRVKNVLASHSDHLDLSGLGLTTLPDEFPSNIHHLILRGNKLEKLSNHFPAGLSILNASNNQIDTLPDTLPAELTYLDISDNKLTILPPHWPDNLKSLIFRDNMLMRLPDYDDSFFSGLSLLDLRGNKLNTVPDNLILAKGIASVYLADNPLFDSVINTLRQAHYVSADREVFDLPETTTEKRLYAEWGKWVDSALTPGEKRIRQAVVSKMTNCLVNGFTSLDLSNYNLTSLPDAFPPELTKLDISYNRLTTLPGNLPGTLTYLDASENDISIITTDLPDSLIVLNLCNNRLSRLPDVLPPRLSTLLALGNEIDVLPAFSDAFLSSLVALNLSENHITTIPDNLINLRNSNSRIDLSNNPLTDDILLALRQRFLAQAPGLPSYKLPLRSIEIAYLNSLKDWVRASPTALEETDRGTAVDRIMDCLLRNKTKLDLSSLNLTTLPDELPPQLTHLDISGNQLTTLSNHLPAGLKKLYADHNNIHVLPTNLPVGLQIIDLSYNLISSLPAWSAEFVSSIESLNLSHNQLKSIPINILQAFNNNVMFIIESNDFSPDAIDQMRAIVTNSNYHGAFIDIFAQDLKQLYLDSWNSWVNAAVDPTEKTVRASVFHKIEAAFDNDETYLNLSGLDLTSLPERLPPTLTALDVSDNKLTELPEHLPASLKHLYANNNTLSKLPDNLPPRLIYLEVDNNKLVTLPDHLPDDLKGVSVRNNLLTRLPLPSDLLTVSWFRADGNRQPLSVAVTAWFSGDPDSVTGQWQSLDSEGNSIFLGDLLVRLLWTKNGKSAGFKTQVVAWLEQLLADPTLQESAFAKASEAFDTCDDKALLVFNTLQDESLTQAITTGQLDTKLPDLLSVARELFRRQALDRIAKAKADLLFPAGNTDNPEHVEVELGYQVALKQRLGLTHTIDDMNYFTSSNLTQADLDAAEAEVKSQESTQFSSWLAHWAPWQGVLERFDGDAFDDARENLIEKLDETAARENTEYLRRGYTGSNDATITPAVKKEVESLVEQQLYEECYGPIATQLFTDAGLVHLLDDPWVAQGANGSGMPPIQRLLDLNDLLQSGLHNLADIVSQQQMDGIHVRFAPQSFLLGENSDVGICAPLSEAWLFALSQDETGTLKNALLDDVYRRSRRLINDAVTSAGTAGVPSDTQHFLDTLLALNTSGSRTTMSLDDVVNQLVTATDDIYLSLYTGNHALGLARRTMDGKTSYYFYDPNLGEVELPVSAASGAAAALSSLLGDIFEMNVGNGQTTLAETYHTVVSAGKYTFAVQTFSPASAGKQPEFQALQTLLTTDGGAPVTTTTVTPVLLPAELDSLSQNTPAQITNTLNTSDALAALQNLTPAEIDKATNAPSLGLVQLKNQLDVGRSTPTTGGQSDTVTHLESLAGTENASSTAAYIMKIIQDSQNALVEDMKQLSDRIDEQVTAEHHAVTDIAEDVPFRFDEITQKLIVTLRDSEGNLTEFPVDLSDFSGHSQGLLTQAIKTLQSPESSGTPGTAETVSGALGRGIGALMTIKSLEGMFDSLKHGSSGGALASAGWTIYGMASLAGVDRLIMDKIGQMAGNILFRSAAVPVQDMASFVSQATRSLLMTAGLESERVIAMVSDVIARLPVIALAFGAWSVSNDVKALNADEAAGMPGWKIDTDKADIGLDVISTFLQTAAPFTGPAAPFVEAAGMLVMAIRMSVDDISNELHTGRTGEAAANIIETILVPGSSIIRGLIKELSGDPTIMAVNNIDNLFNISVDKTHSDQHWLDLTKGSLKSDDDLKVIGNPANYAGDLHVDFSQVGKNGGKITISGQHAPGVGFFSGEDNTGQFSDTRNVKNGIDYIILGTGAEYDEHGTLAAGVAFSAMEHITANAQDNVFIAPLNDGVVTDKDGGKSLYRYAIDAGDGDDILYAARGQYEFEGGSGSDTVYGAQVSGDQPDQVLVWDLTAQKTIPAMLAIDEPHQFVTTITADQMGKLPSVDKRTMLQKTQIEAHGVENVTGSYRANVIVYDSDQRGEASTGTVTTAGASQEVFVGNSERNIIRTGGGNDVIYRSGGNDMLMINRSYTLVSHHGADHSSYATSDTERAALLAEGTEKQSMLYTEVTLITANGVTPGSDIVSLEGAHYKDIRIQDTGNGILVGYGDTSTGLYVRVADRAALAGLHFLTDDGVTFQVKTPADSSQPLSLDIESVNVAMMLQNPAGDLTLPQATGEDGFSIEVSQGDSLTLPLSWKNGTLVLDAFFSELQFKQDNSGHFIINTGSDPLTSQNKKNLQVSINPSEVTTVHLHTKDGYYFDMTQQNGQWVKQNVQVQVSSMQDGQVLTSDLLKALLTQGAGAVSSDTLTRPEWRARQLADGVTGNAVIVDDTPDGWLVGGEGDDSLMAKSGTTLLDGGAGQDTYVLARGQGTVVIADSGIHGATNNWGTGKPDGKPSLVVFHDVGFNEIQSELSAVSVNGASFSVLSLMASGTSSVTAKLLANDLDGYQFITADGVSFVYQANAKGQLVQHIVSFSQTLWDQWYSATSGHQAPDINLILARLEGRYDGSSNANNITLNQPGARVTPGKGNEVLHLNASGNDMVVLTLGDGNKTLYLDAPANAAVAGSVVQLVNMSLSNMVAESWDNVSASDASQLPGLATGTPKTSVANPSLSGALAPNQLIRFTGKIWLKAGVSYLFYDTSNALTSFSLSDPSSASDGGLKMAGDRRNNMGFGNYYFTRHDGFYDITWWVYSPDSAGSYILQSRDADASPESLHVLTSVAVTPAQPTSTPSSTSGKVLLNFTDVQQHDIRYSVSADGKTFTLSAGQGSALVSTTLLIADSDKYQVITADGFISVIDNGTLVTKEADFSLRKDTQPMDFSASQQVTGPGEWFMVSGNDNNNVFIAGPKQAVMVNAGAGDDNVQGSSQGDILSGGEGNDTLRGKEGDDALNGGNGADLIDGGAGVDTVFYLGDATKKQGVIVDLSLGKGQGADAEGDTLIDVENVQGSAFDDILSGNAGDNVLEGGEGNDILSGGGGYDALRGNEGADTYKIARGDQVIISQERNGTATDVLDFGDANPADLSFTLSGFDLLIRGGQRTVLLKNWTKGDTLYTLTGNNKALYAPFTTTTLPVLQGFGHLAKLFDSTGFYKTIDTAALYQQAVSVFGEASVNQAEFSSADGVSFHFTALTGADGKAQRALIVDKVDTMKFKFSLGVNMLTGVDILVADITSLAHSPNNMGDGLLISTKGFDQMVLKYLSPKPLLDAGTLQPLVWTQLANEWYLTSLPGGGTVKTYDSPDDIQGLVLAFSDSQGTSLDLSFTNGKVSQASYGLAGDFTSINANALYQQAVTVLGEKNTSQVEFSSHDGVSFHFASFTGADGKAPRALVVDRVDVTKFGSIAEVNLGVGNKLVGVDILVADITSLAQAQAVGGKMLMIGTELVDKTVLKYTSSKPLLATGTLQPLVWTQGGDQWYLTLPGGGIVNAYDNPKDIQGLVLALNDAQGTSLDLSFTNGKVSQASYGLAADFKNIDSNALYQQTVVVLGKDNVSQMVLSSGDGIRFHFVTDNTGAPSMVVDYGAQLTGVKSELPQPLQGQIAISQVLGSAYNDVLSGSSANNALYGQQGDDVLSGGGGNDLLVGGAGNDTYIVNAGDHVVISQEGNGTGTDRLLFTRGVQASLHASLQGNDLLIRQDDSGSIAVLKDWKTGNTHYALAGLTEEQTGAWIQTELSRPDALKALQLTYKGFPQNVSVRNSGWSGVGISAAQEDNGIVLTGVNSGGYNITSVTFDNQADYTLSMKITGTADALKGFSFDLKTTGGSVLGTGSLVNINADGDNAEKTFVVELDIDGAAVKDVHNDDTLQIDVSAINGACTISDMTLQKLTGAMATFDFTEGNGVSGGQAWRQEVTPLLASVGQK